MNIILSGNKKLIHIYINWEEDLSDFNRAEFVEVSVNYEYFPKLFNFIHILF